MEKQPGPGSTDYGLNRYLRLALHTGLLQVENVIQVPLLMAALLQISTRYSSPLMMMTVISPMAHQTAVVSGMHSITTISHAVPVRLIIMFAPNRPHLLFMLPLLMNKLHLHGL